MPQKIHRYSRELKRRRFSENINAKLPFICFSVSSTSLRLQYFAGIRHKRVSVLTTKGQQVLVRTPEISTRLMNMEGATG